MSKEQLQTTVESAEEKVDAKISPEKTEAEKAEEVTAASEKEVADFENEEESEIARAEQIVAGDEMHEMHGMHIDAKDVTELEECNQKAEVAQAEMISEIGGDGDRDDRGEKFGGFIKDRKEFYRENDMDVLKEAIRDKDSALVDAEYNKKHFEEYTIKVEELRSEIEYKKSSIIKRVLEFRKIKDLEKKLGTQKEFQEMYERRTAQKKELADAYDYLIKEETKLSAIMEEAHKENAEWDENKRLEFIKEEDRRDVSKLAKEHGVFFCHDIVDAEWKPSANNRAIDTKKLDFNNQLDILHGLDPTISVSTLNVGSKQRTFGKGSWGVFLSGGRVLGGERSDAGTVAIGLRDRRFCSASSTTTESIEDAICNREDSSSYNELVVESPEIAGVYAKWDDNMPKLKEGGDIILSNVKKHNSWDKNLVYKEEEREKYAGWWERISDVMGRGMPVYIINRNNNMTRMMYDIDVKNKSFKVTPEYRPEQLSNMPGIYQQHLGKEEKRKAAMRVFDKATGLIPEDERSEYIPDGTEKDAENLYNIH